MDEELRAYLVAMEQRIFGSINNGIERVLNLINDTRGDLRNLRSEHSVSRTLITELPATVLGAIEKPLLSRVTDIEQRLTKLERKDGSDG